MAMLRRLLFSYAIVLFAAPGAWAATFQSTGLYSSYSELAAWASELQSQNPNLVKVVQYGQTTAGRALLALDITVDPSVNNPAKPEFLFMAGIHAREVITSQAAITLAETLVNGYRANDPTYVDMLSTRDVWIIPNQNPDGRNVVELGRSDQRKNMHWYSGQSVNTYTCGVDLNRNYPHKWSLGSSYVTDETYHGPSALSEPEAYSLWNMLHDTTVFSNLLCAVDFHSGAETILTPWTSNEEYISSPLPAADRAKFDFLAASLHDATGYATDRLGYSSWGTLTDSLYEEFGTYAMTEEIYEGPFLDYFTYFNPIDQATRDMAIGHAVNSAMFLLSDQAFSSTVPEPSTLVLLAAAACIAAIVAIRGKGVL